MRKITKIIVHCTATPEGREVSVKDITQWHLLRGFKDIGYHYVVSLNGFCQIGRDEKKIGAHCVGHNRDSIGVCYVGGLDVNRKPKDTRTPEQKNSLNFLLHTLKQKYPGSQIYGHNDFDKGKACPSFDAKTEYANL
jgi:N-acetylmuramoyl-L-alanine amidase